MISVDTAINRGKWLFKYPWKLWGVLIILYLIPPFVISISENGLLFNTVIIAFNKLEYLFLGAFMDAKFWEFVFESTASKIGFIIIICGFITNTVLYFSFYKKWKQWAFENVDDPDMFLREAIKNHFFMTSRELETINRR